MLPPFSRRISAVVDLSVATAHQNPTADESSFTSNAVRCGAALAAVPRGTATQCTPGVNEP